MHSKKVNETLFGGRDKAELFGRFMGIRDYYGFA
jgi:hypothetical protein